MPSGWQRGLKGGHEVLSLLHRRLPVLSRNARGTAGQCTVHQTSPGLLPLEAEWTINRDKLKYPVIASLPGFLMVFEEPVSYSLGSNIRTRKAK